MNDYDRDIALAVERDGVRTQSGQHIATPEAVEACPAMSHADRCAQIQEQEINKARISAYAENARRDADIIKASDLRVGHHFRGGVIVSVEDCGTCVEVELHQAVDGGDGVAVTGFVFRNDDLVIAPQPEDDECAHWYDGQGQCIHGCAGELPEPEDREDYFGPDPWVDRRDDDR